MESWAETDISFIKRVHNALPSPKTDPQRNREITLPREGLVTKEWSADFPKMLRLFFFDTSAIHSKHCRHFNQSIQ